MIPREIVRKLDITDTQKCVSEFSENRIVCEWLSYLNKSKTESIWITSKVAAAMLGITPNALRIRKFRGEIECRYFGSQLRFNIFYINSLLLEKRNKCVE